MLVAINSHYTPTSDIETLTRLRDEARANYFNHSDPGGLTDAEELAWRWDHFALQLIMTAAQKRLDAEIALRAMIKIGEAAE